MEFRRGDDTAKGVVVANNNIVWNSMVCHYIKETIMDVRL